MPEAGACSAAFQKPFPGAVFPWDFCPAQDYGRAYLPGFCRCSAWCGHNLLETWDSLYCIFKGAQDISETPKFSWEWQFSWYAWDFQLYIQQYMQSRGSWISRCEVLRKITSSSNSNQANFQEETIFTWRNPYVKLGERITKKVSIV